MRGTLAGCLPHPVEKKNIKASRPPSVWPTSLPPSCIPKPSPAPRPTKRASFTIRAKQPDQLDAFRKSDQVSFNDIKERVSSKSHEFCCPVTSYISNQAFFIQSLDMSEGVPRFVLQIDDTLQFKAFHMVSIPCSAKNRTGHLNSWSAIEETIRYLNAHKESQQVTVLHDQLRAMRAKGSNRKIYTPEDLVQAFSHYAWSRTLYQKLRNNFKLPSESTLTSITSTCSKQRIKMSLVV